MHSTIAQVNNASIKRFDIFMLFIYLAGCLLAVSAEWHNQDLQIKSIAEQQQEYSSFEQLVKVSSTDDGAILYQTKQQYFPFTRLVVVKDKALNLYFLHPVIVMLSTWWFITASLIYGIGCFIARISIARANIKALKHISSLERWAYWSKLQGKASQVEGDDILALTISSLQTQLKDAGNRQAKVEQLIREQALLDRETGIGNREFFTNRLEALLYEEEAHGAVFLINLKELELVQTMYGEEQSLELLNGIITVINRRLVSVNNFFIARRSEYEIAILVPNLFVNETEKLANKLITALSNITYPVGINQDETCHMGVSCFTNKQLGYQIMAEADMALRSAQLQGPNQWFMYDSGEVIQESAKGSLKWRTFLTSAIEKNAFVIFFQPVIASDNEQILHHEVLSKVRDNQGKLISARVFLPMAQKCGLSVQVDTLVFEQACRLLEYENSHKDSCSLNVSVDALLSESFQMMLFKKLAEMPDIAHRIIIEVSEYYLASQLSKLTPVLQFLHELGVKILADKVGQYVVDTDYISECPIDFIKLHRSLVHQIHEKLENQVYIQSLNARCQAYDVSMFALGVENKQEWQTLTKLGVTGGQGHFFTEPVAQMANAIELN